MILNVHQWGSSVGEDLVCIHGITQEGSIFEAMAERLAQHGYAVTAVDLRGHGASGHEPPWAVDTHTSDILETLDGLGLERSTWIGHSFGGRIAATLATVVQDRTNSLILLDPGLEVPADRALRKAEVDRLDWSFATMDGAVNALLAGDAVISPPTDVIRAYVGRNVQKGTDGRYRFCFSPSAVVTAWSEMTLPAPPIAPVPTLVVRAAHPLLDGRPQVERYRTSLGEMLTSVEVPNGHNVLWEAPTQTIQAIEAFLKERRTS